MKWLVFILAVVVGVPLLMILVGLVLPREHVAAVSIVLRQAPESVWTVVRDARDAAVARLAERWRAAAGGGTPVTGADLDDAARGVIAAAGYGEWFVHRTGHSIDRDLHGSGPHLDNFETADTRELLPGIGFSVEPGIYLPGRFGVRSEINVHLGDAGPEVTPAAPQRELQIV